MGIKNVGFVEDQPTQWVTDLDVLGTTAELPELDRPLPGDARLHRPAHEPLS